jgi:cytochrome P450
MKTKKDKYNLPGGYSFLESVIRSKEFLKHPIQFIEKTIAKFPAGTYHSSSGLHTKVIVTQNPGFINYVLRENNKNYSKSPFSETASNYFGKGLLYANGDDWLRQRRLIQPGFHKEKIQGLYGIVQKSIKDFLINFPVGGKIDIYPAVHQLSFNILIKSLFDIDLSPKIMTELEDIFRDLQDFLLTDINQPWRKLFYPLTGTLQVNQGKAKRLREIISEIIRQRKASTQIYSDLLDMLLE